jgi:phage shock protein C
MKRIYRSRKDRVISGVCGGLAKYLGVDVTIIRVVWAVMIFVVGTGLLAYIIAMIIIPQEPLEDDSGLSNATGKEGRVDSSTEPKNEYFGSSTSDSNNNNNVTKLVLLVIGIIILLIGISSLLGNFLGWSIGWLFGWIGRLVWPLIIIGVGLAILVNYSRK